MASKVSQLKILSTLSGDEDVLIAYKGANWRVKISSILAAFDKKAINLDKVDNTPDLDKPISRAVQQALDDLAAGAPSVTIQDVQGLPDALTGIDQAFAAVAQSLSQKLDATATFSIDEINGLQLALSSKAAASHTHALSGIAGLTEALQEISGALSNKADSMHSHSTESISGLNQLIAELTKNHIPTVQAGQHEW